MNGFPSFFEKRSSCSRSNGRIPICRDTDIATNATVATAANPATATPSNINNKYVAVVAKENRVEALENSDELNQYPCFATATDATNNLFAAVEPATVATPDPTSHEPVYMSGEERPVLTRDQILAIPIQNCLDCFRFQVAEAHCKFYGHFMPEPTKPCRCRHFRRRGAVH